MKLYENDARDIALKLTIAAIQGSQASVTAADVVQFYEAVYQHLMKAENVDEDREVG